MRVARLLRERHTGTVAEAYSGIGAAIAGGRWNSRTVPAAYASASVSLAALEILVNADRSDLAGAYAIAYLELPDEAVEKVAALPKNWNAAEVTSATQRIGDRFIAEAKRVALAVPSVIVPSEYNYLINPRHKAFAALRFDRKLVPFYFDERLFAASG